MNSRFCSSEELQNFEAFEDICDIEKQEKSIEFCQIV